MFFAVDIVFLKIETSNKYYFKKTICFGENILIPLAFIVLTLDSILIPIWNHQTVEQHLLNYCNSYEDQLLFLSVLKVYYLFFCFLNLFQKVFVEFSHLWLLFYRFLPHIFIYIFYFFIGKFIWNFSLWRNLWTRHASSEGVQGVWTPALFNRVQIVPSNS